MSLPTSVWFLPFIYFQLLFLDYRQIFSRCFTFSTKSMLEDLYLTLLYVPLVLC